MSLKTFYKAIGIIIGLVLLVVVALLISNQKGKDTPTPTPKDIVPERKTMSGTYIDCLPRQDNFSSEPCVAGMKTDAGEYYAIDLGLMSQTPPVFTPGDYFTANGILTPREMISSDQTRESVGKGVFSITDSVVITPKSTSRPTPPVTGKCYVGGCSSQLCTDKPDMVSTCEYREAYACYQTATCERQASGQCGWTPTPALSQCLGS